MSNVFTRRREKLLALKSLRSGGPRSAPAPACPACGAEQVWTVKLPYPPQPECHQLH